MLDRSKLVNQITQNLNQITLQQDSQLELAIKIWQQISNDHSFKLAMQNAKLPFSVPNWQGLLGDFEIVKPSQIDYCLVSSDGSQIYPDRHMGNNYYLINIGLVIFNYDQQSTFTPSTTPHFLTQLNHEQIGMTDLVDSARHELEIAAGLTACLKLISEPTNCLPKIYLADGSLIAWHLFNKGSERHEEFLLNYLGQLEAFYFHKIPFVAYTSLPNSTDLLNLLRAKVSNFEFKKDDKLDFLQLVDADFLAHVLPVGAFTPWFKSRVAAIENYPQHLKPYFAYFNTGYEIARIEVPAWLAQDLDLLNSVRQIIFDQANKGYGYPIALAEAHQQAVIKSLDRDFFYQTINHLTNSTFGKNKLSRKAHQKKVMNY